MNPVRTGVRARVAAVAGTLAAVTLSGCAGSSAGGASSAATPSRPLTPTCPSAAASASPVGHGSATVLRHLPAGMPLPPNLTPLDARTAGGGVHVVRFTTPMSLRDSVLFILGHYPKAGYVLGRGDAEATEADAPFVHGRVRGLTRVEVVQPCTTMWLVSSVTTRAGASPVLSPHPASSDTSPQPPASSSAPSG